LTADTRQLIAKAKRMSTPLVEPFEIHFEFDGTPYDARITYAKADSSCKNIFDVMILEPSGITPFTLIEKPAEQDDEEEMLWVDSAGMYSDLYQAIGTEIAEYMKSQLGVVLIDTNLSSNLNNNSGSDV
jgi:hypothetical protein